MKMGLSNSICSLNLRSIETALELADINGALENYLHMEWVSADILVPDYLQSFPECPEKGRYFLIKNEANFVPVCTYHHPDKSVICSLIMEAYINRLLTYEGAEFIMGAQGKHTGIKDLIAIIDIQGFEKGWSAWTKGKDAVDCSALAIEAMRDALEGIYRNSTLIPDTGAVNLGHLEEGFSYTEKVKTSTIPLDMTDPCLELKPGDLCIIKAPLPHTTIFLGRYREKKGDNNAYWIWASDSLSNTAIFTHGDFCKAFKKYRDQTVSRWTLKKYTP